MKNFLEIKNNGLTFVLLQILQAVFLIFLIVTCSLAHSEQFSKVKINNLGMSGHIDLPSARALPNGELTITQQVHNSLARASLSSQITPNLGLAFHYSGHGRGGREAYGRTNHDRSFDAHFSLVKEGALFPAISIGLRDFLGTGWYSSEYIVGTKSFGDFELSVGLGFGRLAGKNSFQNPLSNLYSRFKDRSTNNIATGGTISSLNWFQGETSIFGAASYQLTPKISLSAEYNPDLMGREKDYLKVKNNFNFGLNFKINDYYAFSTQYLHGTTFSLTGILSTNPKRPPFGAGLELAPVPVRIRNGNFHKVKSTNEALIKKVLKVDGYQILDLKENKSSARIDLINYKFRSPAQAIGRVASTYQRFAKDNIKTLQIVFHTRDLQVASYQVDLDQITNQQFGLQKFDNITTSIKPVNSLALETKIEKDFWSWSLGPYITHRLFNPDLPLSAEAGAEFSFTANLNRNLKLDGSLRKSILTNLTDNERRSNSVLPRVHSDWPLYDFAGQDGHIHNLNFSYFKNITPTLYGRVHTGYLEPFFSGIGAEILYKPIEANLAIGLDIHRVKKRDYDMLFGLRDYMTTLGHLSLYYDHGGMFDLEINLGRYLAGDWGVTSNISRRFKNGWEVGGYATLTDVPFETFGEGSFDKGIYVSIPIDWVVGTPNQTIRKLAIRPITRDGGAQLASARKLYKLLENTHYAQFKREQGRLWK